MVTLGLLATLVLALWTSVGKFTVDNAEEKLRIGMEEYKAQLRNHRFVRITTERKNGQTLAVTQRSTLLYKRAPECFLDVQQTQLLEQTPGVRFGEGSSVRCRNSDYSFSLVMVNGKWTLTSIDRSPTRDQRIFEPTTAYQDQPFTLLETQLSLMLKDKEAHITSVAEKADGVVRLSVKRVSEKNNSLSFEGWLDIDCTRCGVMRRAHLERHVGDGTIINELTNEYANDGETFYLVSQRIETKGINLPGPGAYTDIVSVAYELPGDGQIAQGDFTLAAFGIVEPVGHGKWRWHWPVLWVAGGACAVALAQAVRRVVARRQAR